MTIQDDLSSFFMAKARWRERKAREHTSAYQNWQAVDALRAIAEHVKGLPDDDPRIVAARSIGRDVSRDGLEGGIQPSRPASRIGFAVEAVDPDDELTLYVLACLEGHLRLAEGGRRQQIEALWRDLVHWAGG